LRIRAIAQSAVPSCNRFFLEEISNSVESDRFMCQCRKSCGQAAPTQSSVWATPEGDRTFLPVPFGRWRKAPAEGDRYASFSLELR